MVPRRVVLGGAAALAALTWGAAPAVAAAPTPSGCSFSQGTTTCVTTESAVTTYDAPHGVDGTRISTGPTVWGDACLSFEPTTWYYGAFDGTTVETEVTTTSTTTYRGRTAHHDKKTSSTTGRVASGLPGQRWCDLLLHHQAPGPVRLRRAVPRLTG